MLALLRKRKKDYISAKTDRLICQREYKKRLVILLRAFPKAHLDQNDQSQVDSVLQKLELEIFELRKEFNTGRVGHIL